MKSYFGEKEFSNAKRHFNYYRRWFINKKYTSLTGEQIRTLDACIYYSQGSTIRDTAQRYGISSTSFWRRIHNDCKEISPALYEEVKEQIKKNLRKVGR